MIESANNWLRLVAPLAARLNGGNRRNNAREAATWLQTTRERFLGLDTQTLSDEQLRIVKRLADDMVARTYAELWGRESGLAVPAYDSPEWAAFYDRWLESN